jgi:hypothetical protein
MQNKKMRLWLGPIVGPGSPGFAIACTATLWIAPAALAQRDAFHQNQDWPCRQILVERISVAAVWSGPPIDNVPWQKDSAVATLVAQLAARRTQLNDAEHLIEEFALTQGANKVNRLIAVFAGLFETLNVERAQVIDGLLQFGAKQRELAARISAGSAPTQRNGTIPAQNPGEQVSDPSAQQLEWDMRVFDERRQSIAFVCESPTLIEQRLFGLARAIQRNLQ